MTGPFFDNSGGGSFPNSAITAIADQFKMTVDEFNAALSENRIANQDLYKNVSNLVKDVNNIPHNRALNANQGAIVQSIVQNLTTHTSEAMRRVVGEVSKLFGDEYARRTADVDIQERILRNTIKQHGKNSVEANQERQNLNTLRDIRDQLYNNYNTSKSAKDRFDTRYQQIEDQLRVHQQQLNADSQAYDKLGWFGKARWNLRDKFFNGVGESMYRSFYKEGMGQYGNNYLDARAYASRRMRALGWASAKYTGPDYDPDGGGGPPPPGGSASRRTEADRFINRFVDALSRTPFAKKLSTLAQDGALALTLAWASKAPPWLQQTLLTAIALGIPQSLTMVLTSLGGQLLGTLLRRGLRSLLTPLITRFGAGTLLGGALSGIGGAVAGFTLSNGIIDSVGKRRLAEGGNASQVHGAMGLSGLLVGMGGAIVATLGTIFAATLGPILAPFVIAFGVIAGIVGIVRGIFNLNKSNNEAQQEGLGFWQWLKDICPWGDKTNNGSGIGSPANNHYLWYPTGEEVKGDGNSLLGHRITSSFGKRIHPKGTGSAYDGKEHFHTGIDLAYKEGEEVFSNVSGSVIKVAEGDNGGFGNTVYVRDEYGVVHQYSHLKGIGNKITKGMSISRGTLLGQAGHTGYATGPHLHYQTMRDGVAIDPEAYAKEYESKQKAKDTVESVRRRNQEKQIKNAQEVSKKYQTPIPASNNTKDSQNLTWTEFILGAGICSVPFNK